MRTTAGCSALHIIDFSERQSDASRCGIFQPSQFECKCDYEAYDFFVHILGHFMKNAAST